jgi:hypothetical protein
MGLIAGTSEAPTVDARPGLLVAGVLAAAATAALVPFALWHLQRTGLWYDESMQFWMALGGDGFDAPLTPAGTVHDAIMSNAWGNLDPGGFTLALRAWMSLGGESALWQRALPLSLFLLGMAALAGLGWTWRRSVAFAALAGLVPALFPLLLDYATEVRAYSMEFAGICLGALCVARLIERPTVGRALVAGFVIGVFLSSRYSYVLFAAAVCASLIWVALAQRPTGRASVLSLALAFAAPLLAIGGLLARYPVRLQYKLRIAHEGGDYLAYLDPLKATGKSAADIAATAAGNLLHPAAAPLTALALIGVAALIAPAWRHRFAFASPAPQTAAFAIVGLVTLAATAIVWPWHPWDIDTKWSLYLHTLSAIAIVRFAASALSFADAPAGTGLERDWRVGAMLLAGVLALDIRLAMHHRPAGNTLVDTLAYLQARPPLPDTVAVIGHWYPTVRYFYEYGDFRGSTFYPAAFRAGYRGSTEPLFDSATRFVISSVSPEVLRDIEPGVALARDASLPPHLYRVEAPAHGGSGPGDASE